MISDGFGFKDFLKLSFTKIRLILRSFPCFPRNVICQQNLEIVRISLDTQCEECQENNTNRTNIQNMVCLYYLV